MGSLVNIRGHPIPYRTYCLLLHTHPVQSVPRYQYTSILQCLYCIYSYSVCPINVVRTRYILRQQSTRAWRIPDTRWYVFFCCVSQIPRRCTLPGQRQRVQEQQRRSQVSRGQSAPTLLKYPQSLGSREPTPFAEVPTIVRLASLYPATKATYGRGRTASTDNSREALFQGIRAPLAAPVARYPISLQVSV